MSSNPSRTFSGTYTPARGGREHAYDGNWEQQGKVVSWSARVRCGNDDPRILDGTINVGAPGNCQNAVMRAVEASIDRGK